MKKKIVRYCCQQFLCAAMYKIILLLIAGFLVLSSFSRTEAPQNYTMSYVFKNPDGTPFRVIKYYLLEGMKFRVEYYSFNTPTEINVSAEAELNLDNAAVKEVSKVNVDVNEVNKLQAPDLTGLEAHTIEILRNDKKLVWSMEPSFKQYVEVPLREDSWRRSLMTIVINNFADYKKTGETKLLNYSCSMYENVQKIGDNSWISILYVADGLNVILKAETFKNGTLFQLQEATEFRQDKPEQALFEIPKGYQKNDNNQ